MPNNTPTHHRPLPIYNMDPSLGALIHPQPPPHQAPPHAVPVAQELGAEPAWDGRRSGGTGAPSGADTDGPALAAQEPCAQPAPMDAASAAQEPWAEPRQGAGGALHPVGAREAWVRN